MTSLGALVAYIAHCILDVYHNGLLKLNSSHSPVDEAWAGMWGLCHIWIGHVMYCSFLIGLLYRGRGMVKRRRSLDASLPWVIGCLTGGGLCVMR